MKIKKTFQGTVPANKILNADSSSETDTYSCKYINDISVVVSPTEPTTGEKVWMQHTSNRNTIYVKNDNGVYEEFMKKDEFDCNLLGSVNNEDKTITLSNNNLSNYKFLVVRSGYGNYKSMTTIPVALFKTLITSEKQCCQYVKTYNGYGITSISYVDDTSFKINGAVETSSTGTDTTTYVYGVK